MQREEKQLEASLDALLSQVADLKNSLGSFIYKLENEYDRLTWPSVLDSFALLSGQLNTLNKVLKHEKTPLFRNQVIIPLVLSPDRDEDLMRQTEGRVPVFSHEVVPDHLRTKPDPEVEEQEKQLTTDAARIGADAAQKQIQSLNKMCSNLLEKINKEERESESGGKMPSGIKTNIKSASMHPYQRTCPDLRLLHVCGELMDTRSWTAQLCLKACAYFVPPEPVTASVLRGPLPPQALLPRFQPGHLSRCR
ncbi:mediator of RNA polymerase II transcription subunit 8 isoform X4 [Cervus elaphus]|uniref:mediator of RNA polymerase II transcription subunit 8 isoform X4 n=1 Tax=Cervus canadensis TaxID=1574408 RepID=UPI001C9E20AC|nr:mediator of RNA polymerase II transcription subunit 8 isoform X4 [Cervus canadensis]XP_043734594.1 mediator of RNA polymerase II transcription subunit 8 isoform X4 [Cervus elaphus]